MAEFKVARGTQAVYNGLQTKDNDTVYVATDTGNMYLGSTTLFESNAIVAASASGKTITFTKHGSVGTTTTVTLSLSDMPTTDEMTSAISSAVTSLYKFKGSCTYEELPSSGNVIGDVWDVTNEHEQDGYVYPPGTNYAWDGTSWDPLSGKYSQVQADWSENDITKDSFVKNRTHYVTYEGQGTSYPTESSLTLTLVTNHAYGTCYGYNDYPEGFLDNMNIGTKLSLEIGGVLYEGVYEASGSTYYIGNGYIMSQGLPDTGGGWCIGTMSKGFDNLKLYLDPSLVGSYPAGSLSFVQTSPTYHTLNDNFISDNIARVSQLNTKANDADVVHTTGAETIGGVKTFSDGLITGKLFFGSQITAIPISGSATWNLSDLKTMMKIVLNSASNTITLPQGGNNPFRFQIIVTQDSTGGRDLSFTVANSGTIYNPSEFDFTSGEGDQLCICTVIWTGNEYIYECTPYVGA